jgi:two-component system response regulator YesN
MKILIRTIIVDDETMFRYAMRTCIDWTSYGFELVGDAQDGLEAQKLIEFAAPDVVFTDIKMPRMDGLELINYIKKNYPDIIVIILSCHSEFTYVQQAIKSGAKDYILKLSMNPDSLGMMLEELRLYFAKTRSDQILLKTMDEERQVLRNTFIRMMLQENFFITEQSFNQKKELYNLQIEYTNPIAGLMRLIDTPASGETNAVMAESVEKILLPVTILDYTIIDENQLFFIGRYKTIDRKQLEDAVTRLANTIISDHGRRAVIAVCPDYKRNINELHSLFSYKLMPMADSYFLYEQPVVFTDVRYPPATFMLQSLIEEINQLSKDGLTSHYRDILLRIKMALEDKNLNEKKIKNTLQNIDIIFAAILQEKDRPQYFSVNLSNCYTITELLGQLRDGIQRFRELLLGLDYGKIRNQVRKVINYIFAHPQSNLSLTEASSMANLDAAYFSRLFKKETGKTYSQLYNEIRIQKAKNMLLMDEYKIYEVADMLGFENETYFHKLFKKITAFTPMQYREENIKKVQENTKF